MDLITLAISKGVVTGYWIFPREYFVHHVKVFQLDAKQIQPYRLSDVEVTHLLETTKVRGLHPAVICFFW